MLIIEMEKITYLGLLVAVFSHNILKPYRAHDNLCTQFVVLWLWKLFTFHQWNPKICCLMWIAWLERNRRSFENTEKTLEEFKVLCQRSLFEWFVGVLLIVLLSLGLCFPDFRLLCCLFYPFLVVHHHEQFVF
ncbi:uncharacterized protein LOC126699112 [Quercus robur]|uniref:uncharacterized protein LOC126699112 n=1 Tax=Quercus robur TaxID=38942 RepID=UPI0021614B6F|nr:uncharacterized protein LOC126699112 [Quercus robur]